MSVFEIYKEAINAGGYTVTSMEERIETVYACGKISKEERAELLDLVTDKGDYLDTESIMARLADLDTRLSEIEQSGVKVWSKGMVTAKGQTVLYDALGTGTKQYCRYDGSRESTSLKPCQIVGWVVLDAIGGKITHKTVKTDDGVVIVEVTE